MMDNGMVGGGMWIWMVPVTSLFFAPIRDGEGRFQTEKGAP